MTRLIVTRHGQSIANAEHRFAGHSDFDLSELGYRQAELTGEYIAKHEAPDIIYSSDLLRAYHTAVPTARRLGMQINKTEQLREIFAGEWEGMVTYDIMEKYPDDFAVWRDDYSHCRCTGGESTAEVYERVWQFVERVAKENDGKTVMLSTHATLVRALCARALGLDCHHVGDIPFTHNASVNIFTYENGRLTALQTDIVEHLGDIVTGVHKSFNKQ